jgi:hypothetical protein
MAALRIATSGAVHVDVLVLAVAVPANAQVISIAQARSLPPRAPLSQFS